MHVGGSIGARAALPSFVGEIGHASVSLCFDASWSSSSALWLLLAAEEALVFISSDDATRQRRQVTPRLILDPADAPNLRERHLPPLERRLQLLDPLVLRAELLLLLPRRRPRVGLAAEGDADEEVAQLDPRAQRAAHLEDAVPRAQPAEHGDLVRHLRARVGHADAEEAGVRLGGEAVDRVAEGGVDAVALHGGDADLRLRLLRQRHGAGDGAETSDGMDSHLQPGGAEVLPVGRGEAAAQLARVLVAGAAA
eukprot:CAMPEP_0195572950 /NCGR_PEP_ID=MMETSP0814-20130614/5036_1 /TAXON_ID=97485 /ORGANISM="Prymnesium parvum, Strain Texoma1" /LENGTH=252 /DNA_ID=CAMNT_0040708763 /DNA_START=390 /DNA_END=1144 /DNA_ORIENTATION=-